VAAFRDQLLPLLSLRGLLGFAPSSTSDAREKVVVVSVRGSLVGLVADGARAIIYAHARNLEPMPRALAARMGGEARATAVFRGDDGRRIIPILSLDQLFREDVMQRLGSTEPLQQSESRLDAGREERTFVVFRLGHDEFGIPVEAVDEVARVPDKITRVPNTPEFLEGIVNIRGEVLPVVDQRRRFDMPKLEQGNNRRLIVVRTGRHRAGLIVDTVSEVLRTTSDLIEPAPDLTDSITRLVQGVVNVGPEGRMILLLDPDELLTRAERGLIDKLK
jgi:purine-binding chemotaxis protein CheW